jgi:hypothetical protein
MHGSRFPWLLLAALSLSASPLAAAPQVTNVSLRGLQIGVPTVLVFDGAELAGESRLVTSLPLKSQQLQPDASPNRVAIEVVVDESAQPGVYAVRVASSSGISAPLLFAVDRLPQRPFAEVVESLPVALTGSLSGSEVKKTVFTGKQGQSLVIDVEAQRLGANFKPAVRLYDERGRQVTSAAAQTSLADDARCTVVLPADGKYTLELHDRGFRAAAPGLFRLKMGEFSVADRVHPHAVAIAAPAQLAFLGGNVAAQDTVEVAPGNRTPGEYGAPWPPLPRATGPQPTLLLSDHAEVVETASTPNMQGVGAAHVGISGRLAQAGEEDRYLLNVVPNQKLQVEMHARRLGSPIDGVLSIRNEQGAQLAGADDVPGSLDPNVNEFTVPAGVTKLVIAVKDLHARGGDSFNYYVRVRDLGRPDFSLSVASDRILIPAGGTQVIPVSVARTSYAGPITLELAGLPPLVSVTGNEIAAGASSGLLALSAPPGASGAGIVRVIGRGANEGAGIVRTARAPALPGSRLAPYLRDEIGWGVTAALPLTVAWSPANDMLLQGVTTPATAQLTRAAGLPGTVRLRLVTTQPPVKKTIKENNQDKQVDDPSRQLRLVSDVVLPPDAATASAALHVPADLPTGAWDVALAAELLSPDGKTVVATAYAPVRRLTVQPPLALELTSANTAEGKAGLGTSGQFAGKITRAAGYQQPVVVTLKGLPAGYTAPLVEVPADQGEFALPLQFPFASPPGELKNVQLVALQDPNNPLAARSNALPVTITLTPGEKPTAEKPHEVFEDDANFVALLSEGAGQATTDGEKHSGTAALRVTPDHKQNAKIPGMELKIREKPAAGEYRYLRFAWRKKQGNSLCLQLAHDGQFGPGGSGRAGAKFRYHAGPGSEPYAGSVAIDAALPGQYVVVTRDLFADFGEFTLTGLGFSALDGEAAYFDGIYLGRTLSDFELIGAK